MSQRQVKQDFSPLLHRLQDVVSPREHLCEPGLFSYKCLPDASLPLRVPNHCPNQALVGPCPGHPRLKDSRRHHTTTGRRRPPVGHVTPRTSLLRKIQWPSPVLHAAPRLPGLHRQLSSLAPVPHSTLPESLGLSDSSSHCSSIPGPFYFQNWRKHTPSTQPSLLCPPLRRPLLLSAWRSTSLRVPVLSLSIRVHRGRML